MFFSNYDNQSSDNLSRLHEHDYNVRDIRLPNLLLKFFFINILL